MTRVASKAAWSFAAKVSTIALALSFVLLAPSHVTLAQTPETYSKEAMTQALATKHRYDHYGIRFDSEKAEIQRGDNALLDDVAAAMKSFPEWRLRIIGHTDSSGDRASNEVLSTDRANAVKQALIERGIDAARLEALGMGDRQPVASNDTPEKRAFNRRVELARLDVTTAGDAEAKKLLKAMSDFLAAQKAISFAYDTNYEVVTKDSYKLALASSGTIELSRPDKVRATRTGGFANVETVFDGKTLTLLGKNANFYTQVDVPGTIDQLFDELREKLHRPIPGADLLSSNVYDQLMSEVVEAKDIGSGVIGGVECDHLAFRTKDVDWQIWIAQGARPYPCRYVVTSRQVDQAPQYSIQIRDWRSSTELAAGSFSFVNTTNARKVEPKELAESSELPEHFVVGGAK